ncbi:MiaB/RimO family radical SAM methylthiotransferase [Patescibacteria group bacterium]
MSYKPKKYLIKTLGCQANVADSNTMSGILESLGFEEFKTDKVFKNEKEELLDILPQVDLFVINTCSVRQKSEDKVYGLGKVTSLLNDKKKSVPFTIISGCMVGSVTGSRQRYKFEILKKKTPWANEYMNPSQIFDLPKILHENQLLDEWAIKKYSPENVEAIQPEKEHAFVNISYGCDNFCTFCVVPYARGQEVSRTEKEILFEVKHLANKGYKKITLCGQNVNSWGMSMKDKFEIRTGSDQKIPFADLLNKVHAIETIEKIDFISSNPFDFTKDLVETIKLPKISNYIHIAVQSGNNEVLKNMNRRHTVEEFENLIEEIKIAKPDVEFGTDVIVGFPGETRDQFFDTVKLFERIVFKVAFISMYSPRKGTPAEKFFKDDVSLKEKKWRHNKLTEVWKKTKNE